MPAVDLQSEYAQRRGSWFFASIDFADRGELENALHAIEMTLTYDIDPTFQKSDAELLQRCRALLVARDAGKVSMADAKARWQNSCRNRRPGEQNRQHALKRTGTSAPHRSGNAGRRLFAALWMPALLSSGRPDGDPKRMRLLGEDYVAFRDSDGRVGVLEEQCCHRGSSLMLGRNEDGGLRAITTAGNARSAGRSSKPPSVSDPSFRERFRQEGVSRTAKPAI